MTSCKIMQLCMIILAFIAFIVGYIISPLIFTDKADMLFLAIASAFGGAILATLGEPDEEEEWRNK